MNICYLCRSLTNRGGTENYTYSMAKKLSSQGHQVHVVGDGAILENQWEFGQEQANIRLHHLNFKPIRFPGLWRLEQLLPLYSWQYSRAISAFLPELIKKYKIDIVESPDWGGDANIYMSQRRVPVSVRLHGYPGFKDQFKTGSLKRSLKERLFWKFLRQQIMNADSVTCVSKTYADFASELFKLSGKPIEIIPIGIDTSLFHPDPSIIKEEAVFFAGRLEEDKGIEVLEQAIPEAINHFKNIKFYFAGRDMPYKKTSQTWSQHLIDRFGKDKINYLGVLSQKEMALYFQKSRICVIPSLYEPGGMVALEAMSCGCPVIASKVGGLQENIEQGKTGILVEPNHVPDLAAAILKLLSQESLRIELSQQAQKHIHQNYNLEISAKATLKHYQKVVGAYEQS